MQEKDNFQREKESYYPEDKRKEELFGLWLDDVFYSNYQKRYDRIRRINNKFLQKKGIDVILETLDGKRIYIDEKAAMHYLNKSIPTFAFEIKNRTSGEDGWLYNPKKMTDCYLLGWPNASDVRVPDKNVFTDAEIMAIKRQEIITLLEKFGFTKEYIIERAEYYSERPEECIKTDKGYKVKLPAKNATGFSLSLNETLKERPVNILIPKLILAEHAILHEYVGNKCKEKTA